MNESIFFLHAAIVFGCSIAAFRLGKRALTTWVCLQAVVANLFVLKQITLFGLNVTCSDVFAISGIISLNLLQEHYGMPAAKKAVLDCFYFMLAFALLSQIHILYTPSSQDYTNKAYTSILSSAPRLFLASLLSFFLVQKIDMRLFAWIKKQMPSFSLSLRLLLSLLISQLLDTIFFTCIGLYGLIHSLWDMMLLSFLIKILVIAVFFPLMRLLQKQLSSKERSSS